MFNMNVLGAASAAALSLAVVFGSAASAAPVTITATAPTWSNVVGGSNIDFDTSGGGNSTVTQVFWGNPTTFNGQSGLGFNPSNPPAAVVQTDTIFQLGTLTHYRPADLRRHGGELRAPQPGDHISGAVPTTQVFSYHFLIDETPNSTPMRLSELDALRRRLTFNNLTTSSAFTIGGVPYTIELLGFSNNGGTTISSSFISRRAGATASASMRGSRRRRRCRSPASFALLGAGLLGFAAMRRRSQN